MRIPISRFFHPSNRVVVPTAYNKVTRISNPIFGLSFKLLSGSHKMSIKAAMKLLCIFWSLKVVKFYAQMQENELN